MQMGVARPVEAARPEYSLARLVLYFLKLGTIGFGGPIALAGYMQRDLVDERHWFTEEEYLEGLALAQLAPGPLAAQLAMHLGFVRAGWVGATAVGFVFVAPSFVMVVLLALAYTRYGGLTWMQAVFYGIGAAVIGIIARSAWKLMEATLKMDALLWAIFLALAISTAVTEKEIVWLFLAGGSMHTPAGACGAVHHRHVASPIRQCSPSSRLGVRLPFKSHSAPRPPQTPAASS
jgi:chromate transporter